MHFVSDMNALEFYEALDYLAINCDTFSLVDSNIFRSGFSVHLPPIKKRLTYYLIDRKRVVSWAGTQILVRYENKKPIEHVYSCCKDSTQILKKYYKSFFDIEYQMDISFFKSNQCVLFTISHESILMVDLDFWKDFFDNTFCVLDKGKQG
ncbi:MAG: hypothetical protein LBU32_20895 [Clostridiales bacterium]|jgi:hypothetical protein|nr:hypothetical protein [Clostridiales bacterium]